MALFGKSYEEVEAIVGKRICEERRLWEKGITTIKPCPPPIIWEYMAAVNSLKEVVCLQVEKGKPPQLYYGGYSPAIYSLISDKRFKSDTLARDWVIENEHYIEDAGFSLGLGTKSYKLKKVLDA